MTSFWDRLVGHAPQTALWLTMRRAGRLPHALLLTGPAGIGKRAWALAAAQDLLCREPGDKGPCGRCDSCQALARGAHPDILEASPPNGRFYRVHKTKDHEDEISPLLDWLAQTPILSHHKVLVLDKAEGLRSNAVEHQAADAFLKALEEPALGTYIFFVTDAFHAIIPTISSRCRRLTFSPLDRDAFLKVLGDRLPKPQAETLHRVTRGSPGEALRMIEADLLGLREGLIELLGAPHAKALELAAKRLIPAKPSSKEAAEQEATPTEIRRRESIDRLQLLVSLLRDRLPGVPEEARLHPDLPAATPSAGIAAKIPGVAATMDTILGNTDLTLALECCALSLAAPGR